MVIFGQKLLYLGKSGCNRKNVDVFRQKCFIWAKGVLFGQSGCNLAKLVVFRQSGCVRAKLVVFGQKVL